MLSTHRRCISLQIKIENARRKLNELAKTFPLHSSTIIIQSQQLDELLNEYELELQNKSS